MTEAGVAAAVPAWTLADDAPVALAEADLDGRLRRVNGRFCSLTGREPGALVGVPLRELLHADEQCGHERELRALVEDGVDYCRDERYRRPDGSELWATNEIRRTSDGASLLLAAQAAAPSLTRAELGRARAEDELQRRDAFLNVLSHELRSPLAAILVWARLLREGGTPDEDTEKGLEVIERSGRTIERALDDLVQVARIAGGKPPLACDSLLDLRTVLASAADAVHGEAEKKRVSLLRTLPAKPVTVSGDPGLLQQAIARILANAVKFTPADGSVELQLTSTGEEALIRVQDTGAGMSDTFLPHVFEPFRQDAQPNRAHRGLGLGLFIVRDLVTRQGGRVSAASPGPGKGSVFTVFLPVVSPGLPESATDSLHAPASPARA